jgi:hypothetical protein
MSGEFFRVEMLPAAHGDALWIEYGDAGATNRVLIDGGPVPTYKFIEKRIEQVPDGERYFELIVLTHVDADHVEGLVRLFAEKPLPTVEMGNIVEKKFREILVDLHEVAKCARSDVTVYRGNSRFLSKVLPSSPRVSAVITSPPYPNRFSYARETRPHMFFFDFIEHASAVGELETEAIGGTWGKATSPWNVQ